MTSPQRGKLQQSFGLKLALIIVMSSVIGSGVFKKVAPMADDLHVPWLVVLAWVLAGIIILFGALSIGELGALFPESGGPFVWLEKIYGKKISFLYGWTSFTVIQTAAISSVAFIFSGALDSFVQLPHLSSSWESITVLGIVHPFDNIGAKLVAILLIILLTFVNAKGAKQGGKVSLIFTFIIVSCILLICLLSLSSEKGNIETFATVSSNFPSNGFTFFGFISVMFLAMRNAFWGYEGWIALGFVGEEIKDAHKNLPKAMIYGVLLIMGLYAIINFSYLYVMPIDEMLAATHADENVIPAVLVMDKLFGNSGAYIISAMILVSTAGCTNATILVSSRVYYAMAQKKLFFKGAENCHPIHNTPNNALIYQCIWACVLVFSGTFDLLTDLVVIAAFIFYGLIVFGVFILRKKEKDKPRPYKAIGYPVIPSIFILFCVVLLIVSIYETPWKSAIGVVLILSGLPFYYYWKRKNKV